MNAFINISTTLGNNKLYYTNTSAVVRTLTIDDGNYTYGDINNLLEIQQTMNSDFTTDAQSVKTFDVVLTINEPEGVLQFIIQDGASVDFTETDTPRVILGFLSAVITDLYSDGDLAAGAMIQPVEVINLHCDLITNSYFGSDTNATAIKSGTIYGSYPLEARMEETQVERENNLYLPMKNISELSGIKWWVSSESGIRVNSLTNNKFKFSVRFAIQIGHKI